MGRDVYFQAHLDGGPEGLLAEDILGCFADYISDKADNFVGLTFSEQDGRGIYIDTGSETVNGFTVSRPGVVPALGECLYRVMKLGNFVMFEAGELPTVVVDEKVVEHLPVGMVEALGEPRVAGDLKAFMDIWENP